MSKGYRTYLPEQDLLLPPTLRAWLKEDHLAYFVSDVVDQLDLSAIHAVYEKEKRGQPPYDPCLMTKLLVYGYCTGCSVRVGYRSGCRKTSRSKC
jgi:transposase